MNKYVFFHFFLVFAWLKKHVWNFTKLWPKYFTWTSIKSFVVNWANRWVFVCLVCQVSKPYTFQQTVCYIQMHVYRVRASGVTVDANEFICVHPGGSFVPFILLTQNFPFQTFYVFVDEFEI